MPDMPLPSQSPPPAPPGFPYATAVTTLLTLFAFVGLVMIAYYSPNYFSDTKIVEPKADPATKLREVNAKNQSVLDGSDPGVKMSVGRATGELLDATRKSKDGTHKQGRLPFPIEPPKTPDVKDKK